MDSDVKEVLAAVLAGRAYVFSVFHRLLGSEPDKELFEAVGSDDSLRALELFEDDESGAAAGLKAVLLSCRGMDDEAISRVRDEYTRLFIGPDKLIAPPWESVYTTKERALFQESTLAVRGWYQQYSYVPAGYPSHPDDHISLMMHFMALTAERAAECLADELLCGCRALLEGQRLFEKNHLLNWVGDYARDMDGSATRLLYPQLAGAVADFVAYDNQVIDEMLEALG